MHATRNGKLSSQEFTEKTMQLPILSINSMSEGQLRDFIPKLLKLVQSNMLDKKRKPDWWPNDLPWSDTQTHIKYQQASWVETLRNVVRCCYRHLGQEKLLQESSKDKIKTSYNSTFPASASPALLACLQQNTILSEKKTEKETKRRYSEIYICFFCEKEFSNKAEMRAHQIICDDRPPELHAVSTPPKDLSPKEGNLPPQISPAKINLTEAFVRISKDKFVRALGIVQKQKAARIIERHRCNSMDINCDLNFEEPETPISPPTPRTPKLLISQLSKDDGLSASRKRLSYSQGQGEINDKESVKSCGSNEDERPSHVNKSLFQIDVSSLLGQRVVKYMKDETNLVILKDSESFCRTPDKNEYFDKLRNRSNQYPISYRPRKNFDLAYTFNYKFTRRQRKKMRRKVAKKPTKQSLRKQPQMKLPKCKVVLEKLSKADLRKWIAKSDVQDVIAEVFFDENNNSLFPKIPILHSKDCDKLLGLKKKSLKNLSTKDPLSLTNVVSEDDNAEVSKQKLTLYKCLLSEITDLKSTPVLSKKQKPKPKWSSKKYKQFKSKDELGHLSWLKSEAALVQADVERKMSNFKSGLTSKTDSIEDFNVKRNFDDNISIMSLSLSSDDESYNSRCCSECRRKKRCMCSPLSVSPYVADDKSNKKSENDSFKSLREMLSSKSNSDLTGLNITPSLNCSCVCMDSPKNETDFILKSLPSPPPSARKNPHSQIHRSPCSETGSDGLTTDSENTLATKRSSPYKLRVSSPRKSFPDFELYMQRKLQTTALGERVYNLCSQDSNNSTKPQKTVPSESDKKQKIVSTVSQSGLDILRRSKRIRSPTSMCNSSPAKLRRLETR